MNSKTNLTRKEWKTLLQKVIEHYERELKVCPPEYADSYLERLNTYKTIYDVMFVEGEADKYRKDWRLALI